MSWINKDTEIYCSFAENAGNTGCQMMNSAFYYYNLNKIYKSFSVSNIKDAVNAVKTLNIKGFAITMPYKKQILKFVDTMEDEVRIIGAANTVINNNGYLHAYNTDYLAAKELLKKYKDHKNVYILGNGGYAAAVKHAMNYYNITPIIIERNQLSPSYISDIENSLIYNCTPVENINLWIKSSNIFIDCLVTTPTGYKLATAQASHQFKLYTQLEFPWNI